MTRHYATTAAAAHLPQLRVLHASMRRHCAPFMLHVLAEGHEVSEWCLTQERIGVTTVDDFMVRHPGLRPECLPGAPRRPCELAWAWRWRYMADLLAFLGEPVTVLDVDLMFFSSPEPVFEEIGAAGAAFLPHAFPPASAGLPGANQESHGQWGVFNGGFSVWADPGPAERMAELCREWSWAKHRPTPDARGVTYGEQGNLEWVRDEFGDRVHVIRHPGAAPGPWNVHTQPLRAAHDGRVFFGGRPLVSFHFSSFRIGGQLADAPYEITPKQVELLYDPYVKELGRD